MLLFNVVFFSFSFLSSTETDDYENISGGVIGKQIITHCRNSLSE